MAIVVAGLVGFGLLLAAGAAHLLDPDGLISAIEEQAVLPGPARVWAWSLVAAQLSIGGPGLALTWLGHFEGTIGSFAAMGAFQLLSFAAYLGLVMLRGSTADCGCGGPAAPVGHWSIGRAAFLGIGLAATVAWPAGDRFNSLFESAVTAVAAGSLGTVVWLLPHAMADPFQVRAAA